MNFQYYVNFIAIVEEETLTAASKKLGVAQPALSNQLKSMEQRFGTRLFHRGGQRLVLSDAGRILYEKAKEMVALEQEAQREITSSFSGEEGTLRYGRISGLCGAKWESLMEQYAREYPLISFKSIEADQSSLLKMLVNGLIEVAVLYSDRNIPDTLEVVHAEPDSLVALWKGDCPKFADLPEGVLPYSVFADHPVAVTNTMLQANSAFVRTLGFKPDIRVIGSRMQDCLAFTQRGYTMTILPKLLLKELECVEGLTVRDMEGGGLMPTLTVVAQKCRYRSQVVNNFLKMICQRNCWPMPAEGSGKEYMDIE